MSRPIRRLFVANEDDNMVTVVDVERGVVLGLGLGVVLINAGAVARQVGHLWLTALAITGPKLRAALR